MAFEFADPIHADVDRIDHGHNSTVLCYLERDTKLETSYFVAATLSPYDDYFEYSFTVIERRGNTEREITSGLAAVGLFSKADRIAIRQVVFAATEEFLNWKRPLRIDRRTADPNLPDKAMLKHLLISDVFKKCGYEVTKCEDWNGQAIWQADLVAGNTQEGWLDGHATEARDERGEEKAVCRKGGRAPRRQFCQIEKVGRLQEGR